MIFLDTKYITIYFLPRNFILFFQKLFYMHFITLKFFDALAIG